MTTAAVSTAALVLTGALLTPANAVITPNDFETSATARQLAEALTAVPSHVIGARFQRPDGGPAMAVGNVPLSSFPRAGQSYTVLSTGNPTLAPLPNSSGSTGTTNQIGSGTERGGAYDVAILQVDVRTPPGANCLSVDFRFFSEEFPEFVGSSFNDAFIIELDDNSWTVTGQAVVAPDNFAFDPAGQPITINSTGATSMSAGDAAGTTYDGATPVLEAATPVTPGGEHTVYFSIFDQGDTAYDSTAFIDNLRFSRVADPATGCVAGAKPSTDDVAAPLLGAHGITGVAADMDFALATARDLVPSLQDARSVDTGKVTSVWTNGDVIAQDAVLLTQRTGLPQVNTIAHSKGGLDTRVAMWRNPQLFDALGMLATPNAGSVGADNLCRFRRWGMDGVVANQGPCEGPEDGLHNLQTSYMREDFNPQVRDWPQHRMYVTAGDCTAALPTDQVSAKCNLMDGLTFMAPCPQEMLFEVDGSWRTPPSGNDGVVCVSSAFSRAPGYTQAGLRVGTHHALAPVHRANHGEMRSLRCPVAHVVGSLYGARNSGNPYRSGGTCSNDLVLAPGDGSGGGPVALAATTAGAVAAPAVGPVLREQRVSSVTVRAGVPTVVRVDPEGGDVAALQVWVPAGVAIDATLLPGTPTATLRAGVSEVLDASVHVIELTGLAGKPRDVSLTSGTHVTAGIITTVEEGAAAVRGTVTASPGAPARGVVEVTLTGVSPRDLNRSSLTAVTAGGAAPVRTTLVPTGPARGKDHTRTYRAAVPLAPGQLNVVDVVLDGPVSRTVSLSTVPVDGTGTIHDVTGDALVDSDGDDAVDVLAVDVEVEVDAPGTYELVADFTADGGRVAFSAPGSAELAAGRGVIRLQAPLAALVAGGHDGAYVLADALLTRAGEQRARVAVADRIGSTGPYPLAGLPVRQLQLAGAHLDVVEGEDGSAVAVGARAAVPTAGAYRLSATLTGPDGAMVTAASADLELDSGLVDVRLVFDPVVSVTGRYSVADLTLTRAGGREEATAPAVSAELTGSGGLAASPESLRATWVAERAAGSITSTGLFTSELNRLDRVVRLDADGQSAAASAEVRRFLEHIGSTRSRGIDEAAATRLVTLGRAVAARLDEG